MPSLPRLTRLAGLTPLAVLGGLSCRASVVAAVVGALALAAAPACTPAHGPGLVAGPARDVPALALSPSRALMIPGEEMAWDVYWQGLLVGHADLTVAASEVRTRFQTTALARTFAKVRYELVTTFAPGPARAPTSAREHVVYGGETTDITARLDGSAFALDAGPARGVPGGASLHTLHSALGALRAWSRDGANGGAPSAFAWIEVHGALYRLDVTRPGKGEALGHRALEIHGTLRPLDGATEPLELTVWLAATPDRTPLRVVVVSGDDRVAAELTETTATLSAR